MGLGWTWCGFCDSGKLDEVHILIDVAQAWSSCLSGTVRDGGLRRIGGIAPNWHDGRALAGPTARSSSSGSFTQSPLQKCQRQVSTMLFETVPKRAFSGRDNKSMMKMSLGGYFICSLIHMSSPYVSYFF